ncbi:MAG: methyltransferase domain-containing protein [Rhodospirillaceae bacterium]|nr:methyltransferase domain-containing protein [Rhodospirillaceae bacterium]
MGQEIDIGYFNKDVVRKISRGFRAIGPQMIAFDLGKEYYDGERGNGYGGFGYDGRWQRLLPPLIERYGLTEQSSVLDLGCKKGFIMHDFKQLLPGITVKGVENHPYPIETSMEDIRDDILLWRYDQLPFEDNAFDFVIAFSAIYMENLRGVIGALREIQRVSNGNSFVTLGAYRTLEGRDKFLEWTLLGTSILHVDEWHEVFEYTGYTGDYYFTTAESLNLEWAD